MNFFGDLDGIDVKWRDNKIELYSSSKPLENKLSSSSEVVFIGRIPNAEIPTSHLEYCGYFFNRFIEINIRVVKVISNIK